MPMRALISGAGIAGPTLAFFLAKSGWHITVVEKSSELLSYGQNIDINGSALKVMREMGMIDELRRFHTTEKGTQFIDPAGRAFGQFPATKGASSPTSEFEILRGDLARILFERSKETENVRYLFGQTVKAVYEDEGGKAVRVDFSDGTRDEFDVLVAADGQWSKVRRMCFGAGAEEVKVVDKGSYVAYYTIPRLPSDNDWWNIFIALGSRVVTLRPDPHGTIRAALSRMPCNDVQSKAWQEATRSDRKTQQELLKREFMDAGWQTQRILDAIDDAPDFYMHPIQQIKMSKWSRSRVVCVGDAAYAPTPLSGMGTSLAITGAYVLAGELSGLQKDEHPGKALEAYETVFRPFVDKIQDLPSFVPGIAHPESWWRRWLLQTTVSVISSVMAIRWIGRLFGGDNENDFQLPRYPRLEVKDVK